ncbi:receptor-like protein EIX2 isoform X1 [Ricinus communis]|uniref:receptor-like protein EIX2 isoform X1 n=1 Tax=Ricinus communis TaxID=3988 RepID=UPI00201A9F8F|nr:receptor-like protein EIX2 isoform X1 [Ricinus communis]
MFMGKSMSGILIIPFFCFFFIATTSLGFCYGSFNISGCSPSEREALLKFKHELKDPSKRLTTWVGDGDCCSWSGVICDNLTGHVLELHLRSLSHQEYYDLGRYDYEEYRMKSTFGGSISHFVCRKIHKVKRMRLINLDNNFLSGQIRDCWSSWSNLEYIRLSNNNFSGNIPRSIGTLTFLKSLHLRNNSLSGEIPLSLRDCTSLVSLDLGENQLIGHIPPWMGASFPSMAFLNLRENKFHGHIPPELCQLASLQILDLAHNDLARTIPSCIDKLSAMTTSNPAASFYGYRSLYASASDYATIVSKGRIVEYFSILGFVKSLDLSGNNLSGDIPEVLTKLIGLQSLNLSDNLLSGRIPEDIGAMVEVEAIDFSQNQLFGEIPQSMTKLTYLSDLNLSDNNLSGTIPTGTQLQSFNASSFTGNKGLCGPPLTNNCTVPGVQPRTESSNENRKSDGGFEVNGFYVSMALGFIVGFWGAFGPLVVNRQWRHAYFHFLDHLWDKVRWGLR